MYNSHHLGMVPFHDVPILTLYVCVWTFRKKQSLSRDGALSRCTLLAESLFSNIMFLIIKVVGCEFFRITFKHGIVLVKEALEEIWGLKWAL